MSKQRRNSLGYFFDQIIEIMLPVHMRYLLWAALKGFNFFSLKLNIFCFVDSNHNKYDEML